MKKNNKRKKKSTKKNKQYKNRAKKLLLLIVIACILLSILFVTYTFYKVQKKFDGVRWALPARVYARPLELFVGKDITASQLQYELQLLNYEQSTDLTLLPGSYRKNKNTLDIYTREFAFADGINQACYCRIQLNSVSGIENIIDLRTKQTWPLLRLEPYHFSSIYPLLKEDRDVVALDQVPPLLIDMLLAVEDKDFYQHKGVKPTAIIRALFANIRAGRTVQGGSTLTQQLVKNFFLTNERSLSRKIHEAIIAILLEAKYQKNEILEAYLNEVYLGQQGERAIHGFALASRYYFNRSLSNLRLQELATLVGLVKGPSVYNPFRNKDNALQRRNVVLAIASREGLISQEQEKKLRLKKLSVSKVKSQQTAYPAYIEFLKSQLAQDYAADTLQSEGLRIFSSLDPYIQNVTEVTVVNHLTRLEKQRKIQKGTLQAAALVIDTTNAEIVAMVGDRNPRFSGFNRALQARRPVGSLLKPLVYMEALSHTGLFTASSLLEDQPLQLHYDGKDWAPSNYDQQFHGEVPLFEALANSYNVAAVKLGMTLGLDNILNRIAGILNKHDIPEYPSILLGAVDLSPLEVASLYYPLATKGYQSSFRTTQTVLTANDERIQAYPLRIKQVIDADLSYQINYLLQYVVKTGTARRVAMGNQPLHLAAKTGTSNDLRDSWFVSYSGQHLIVVWVGNDENQPVGLTGSSGALPIAQGVFQRIQSRPLAQKTPDNIRLQWVDKGNGKRSKESCENSVIMPYIAGTEPEEMAKCKHISILKRLFSH